MEKNQKPCHKGPLNAFDHNGECLICDCWPSDCAWDRLWDGDFKYESLDELLVMFKDHLTEVQVQFLKTQHAGRH